MVMHMQEWFYKEYGFSVENFMEPFTIDEIVYQLIMIYNDRNLMFLNRLCGSISNALELPMVEIVPTATGSLYGVYNGQKYVLVCGKEYTMSMEQYFECIRYAAPYFDAISLEKKRELWLKRSVHIEKEIVPWLPIHDMCIRNAANIQLSFAMGETALSYLANIPVPIIPGGLSHLRLSSLSLTEVLNPTMITNDHISRDLVALYEMRIISIDEIMNIFSTLSLHQDEMIYFVSRCLFPARYYDALEDLYIADSCDEKRLYDYKEEYEDKRMLVRHIIEDYHLPTINWI